MNLLTTVVPVGYVCICVPLLRLGARDKLLKGLGGCRLGLDFIGFHSAVLSPITLMCIRVPETRLNSLGQTRNSKGLRFDNGPALIKCHRSSRTLAILRNADYMRLVKPAFPQLLQLSTL